MASNTIMKEQQSNHNENVDVEKTTALPRKQPSPPPPPPPNPRPTQDDDEEEEEQKHGIDVRYPPVSSSFCCGGFDLNGDHQRQTALDPVQKSHDLSPLTDDDDDDDRDDPTVRTTSSSVTTTTTTRAITPPSPADNWRRIQDRNQSSNENTSFEIVVEDDDDDDDQGATSSSLLPLPIDAEDPATNRQKRTSLSATDQVIHGSTVEFENEDNNLDVEEQEDDVDDNDRFHRTLDDVCDYYLQQVVKREPNWKTMLPYILFNIQFMMATVDLFVTTSQYPGWHYAHTSISLVATVGIIMCEAIRFRGIYRLHKEQVRQGQPSIIPSTSDFMKLASLLLISICIQYTALGINIFWLHIPTNPDISDSVLEELLFCFYLLWGFINMLVMPHIMKRVIAERNARARSTLFNLGSATSNVTTTYTSISTVGPVLACYRVLTKHFVKTPWLFLLCSILAPFIALCTTFQGVLINQITQRLAIEYDVQFVSPPNDGSPTIREILTGINGENLNVTQTNQSTKDNDEVADEIYQLSLLLVLCWALKSIGTLGYDIATASMFSKLEIWLRGSIFKSAIEQIESKNVTIIGDRNRKTVPQERQQPLHTGQGQQQQQLRQQEGGLIDKPRPPPSQLQPCRRHTHRQCRPARSSHDRCVTMYQSRYTTAVRGVVQLYGDMLNGILMNVCLVIFAFIFLLAYDFRISMITFGFLAMGMSCGPIDRATMASEEATKKTTKGLGQLTDALARLPTPATDVPPATMTSPMSLPTIANTDSDGGDDRNTNTRKRTPTFSTVTISSNSSPEIAENDGNDSSDQSDHPLVARHREEILAPLSKYLKRKNFYSNSVHTYMEFFASFLSVVVIITMSMQVTQGSLCPCDFIGVFYIFEQVMKKSAVKLVLILQSAIKNSPCLERVDELVFPITTTATTSK